MVEWYDPDWNSRTKVTIGSEKVGSTLFDFPCFLDLSIVGSGLFGSTFNSGSDIRMTTSDGSSEIPREVVHVNTVGSLGEVHFLADLGSTDDNIFYIYYSNENGSDYAGSEVFGRDAVWTNYTTVLHLNQNPGGTEPQFIDSTGGGHDGSALGTMTSADLVDAQVGSGTDFDGTDDSIEIAPSDGLNIGSSDFYISTWFKFNTEGFRMAEKRNQGVGGDPGFHVLPAFSGNTDFRIQTTSTDCRPQITGHTVDSNFHLLAFVVDRSGSVLIYEDGSFFNGADISDCDGESADSNEKLRICALDSGGAPISQNDGTVDEWRFRVMEGADVNDTFSPEWIATEFDNQDNAGSFYTIGSQELFMAPAVEDQAFNSIFFGVNF